MRLPLMSDEMMEHCSQHLAVAGSTGTAVDQCDDLTCTLSVPASLRRSIQLQLPTSLLLKKEKKEEEILISGEAPGCEEHQEGGDD